MKQRPRIYYSDSQKALMWERWKQGADAPSDCWLVRSDALVGASDPRRDRRHPPRRATPIKSGAYAGRARGDLKGRDGG